MSKTHRLDKRLAELSVGTRSEVRDYIRRGRAAVNGEIVKRPEYKVSDEDVITFDGRELIYQQYEYYLLNKPAGIISASSDNNERTVVDLIDSHRKDLFPVGRLDRDTEGLLLITNDGELAHSLLSPKKHVAKTYSARINGQVGEDDIKKMADGIELDDFKALPAELKIISSGTESDILITIYEGKYHQVKRMFQALGKEVAYLKRVSMGSLRLPDTLKAGEYIVLCRNDISC